MVTAARLRGNRQREAASKGGGLTADAMGDVVNRLVMAPVRALERG